MGRIEAVIRIFVPLHDKGTPWDFLTLFSLPSQVGKADTDVQFLQRRVSADILLQLRVP